MSEPKPFASLSPTLLARKGAARPAMRPQLQPLRFDEEPNAYRPPALHQVEAAEEDLGWNDMGEDAADQPGATASFAESPVVPINGGEPVTTPVVTPESPALRQLGELAESMARSPAMVAPRKVRSALKEGRKAAFTLRVDAERHLRLRLACTLQNRSAQSVVTEALDRLLDELPGLDDLARRVKRH